MHKNCPATDDVSNEIAPQLTMSVTGQHSKFKSSSNQVQNCVVQRNTFMNVSAQVNPSDPTVQQIYYLPKLNYGIFSDLWIISKFAAFFFFFVIFLHFVVRDAHWLSLTFVGIYGGIG